MSADREAHAHMLLSWKARALQAEANLATARAALEAINAMPGYAEPVPPEYVSGLAKRFNKALEVARSALASGGEQ